MSPATKGMRKLQHRLSEPDWIQKPTGDFLRSWRDDLRKEVTDNAPNWRGGIVNAIQSAQDTSKFPLWARVFSEAPEARWSEFGTGMLSEDPRSARRRYFPPVDAMRDWSQEHGLDPFTVARGIYNRGGTKPTHFFSDAERSADARLNAKLTRFGVQIQRQASQSI